ncbi:unnamed protein product [Urochloa humidicola]
MEFATGALGTLLPKLGQLLKDEYNLQKGAKNNIKFLSRELESIQAALRNVGEVPPEQLSEQVKIWTGDARELSYDMEDIVDTFLVRVKGSHPPSKKSSKRLITKMKDFLTKAKTQHEIGQEINDIKERVKEVAERRDMYKVEAITPAKTMVDPRITSLYTEAANLVGIDEAREEIITRLTKGDALSAQQKIISIVGIRGLGKTTLAKAVYDKLKGQFDCSSFVPIGRNPDLKKVFKDIYIDLDKEGYMHFKLDILDERQLIDKIREFLENKRYFIVIDDVWETQTWETIKLALIENSSGSRLIATTHKHEVSREAGEGYELQPLSDDDSRKLFFARIFGGQSISCDHQPDEVTDNVLGKCGGIPLAIITMASLLVGKPKEEWPEVHRSIGYGNKGNRQVENTMKILSFSYYNLPSHLRACLLYLSVFPEDYSIEKGPLIRMWIAEGFIQEKHGKTSFEIGEGYFNELVNRSMIQLGETWEGYAVVPSCHVHDMVLDLIRSISSEENFVSVLDGINEVSSSSQGRLRRLALQNGSRTLEAHTEDMQQVRSFISCGCECDIGKVVRLSSCFKLIRVLAIETTSRDLEHHHVQHIRNLLHLRYLRLSGRYIEVPEDIGTLTQLVCLRFSSNVGDLVPDGIAKLTSLEELQIHHRKDDEPWRLFVKELGSLRKLRVLHVGMPSQSTDLRARLIELVESLRSLQEIEQLSVMDENGSSRLAVDPATWEAEGFPLPRRLRRLSLRWISFSGFPSLWINASRLPNLSHLSLEVEDMDEQDLIVLGELPQLCDLSLRVRSGTEVMIGSNPCSSATDDDGGCLLLFQKLRHFRIFYGGIKFKDHQSGSLGFRMRYASASMLLLGSAERKEGKASGIAPTLIPSAQKLEFIVPVRAFIDGIDGGCVSLALEYFTSLHSLRVAIFWEGASLAEMEQVEAALQRAADIHPNRPTLEMQRVC